MSVQLRDLGGAAARLLQLFTTELALFGVTVPVTQYVAPGSIPAWDGEQFTVNLQRIDQGQPGMPQGGSMYRAVFFATFAVSLVREVPALYGDGQPGPSMIPSPEDLNPAGAASMDDAAALILAATAIHEANTFTGPGEGFEVSNVTAIGPQGGLAGQQILISVSVS